MNPDTDSASEERVKVIQGRVAHGTLYVRLTCPTMANRHIDIDILYWLKYIRMLIVIYAQYSTRHKYQYTLQ